MKVTTILAATATLVALTACTTETSEDRQGSTTTSAGPTQEAATSPLELSAHAEEATLCLKRRARADQDWAWVAAQVRVLEDDVSSVSLDIEGEGVEARQAFVVRPANFGGRIDHSGLAAWSDRRQLVDGPQYSPAAELEADRWWSPTEGENVQVILRLRLADAVLAGDAVARITAVTATWQGEDSDDTGTARAATDEHWAVAPGCTALPETE